MPGRHQADRRGPACELLKSVPIGVTTISTIVTGPPRWPANSAPYRRMWRARPPGHDAASRQRTQVDGRAADPDLGAQRHVAQRLPVGVPRRDRDHALRRAVLRQDVRRDGDRHRRRELRRPGQSRRFLLVHRAGRRHGDERDYQSTRDESMRHICVPTAAASTVSSDPRSWRSRSKCAPSADLAAGLVGAVERDLGNRRDARPLMRSAASGASILAMLRTSVKPA